MLSDKARLRKGVKGWGKTRRVVEDDGTIVEYENVQSSRRSKKEPLFAAK
jgi:hypothetical protein